ncbi:E3 ubiquitin-protein ligase NRDP1 [Drosophila obscura]|uniref:E3 ubiquitin-protein ligase NRDP1 n=1 Tax=Drosophila obscura TaxID=7282 RepID=UPI000B9FC371|nr:E3 ubiquitin-protein ligase NRDP1 [Drosophila obscura]
MGYDVNRFQGEVDEELTCPICSGVLEDPLQAVMCEHAFCRGCINEWLTRQPTCPVDRNALTTANLRAVPRILRNLLSRLSITCDNAPYGCTAVLKLDVYNSHLEDCIHNPKRPFPCEKGCGFDIPKDELKDHNCVRELRTLIVKQTEKMVELKSELTDQQLTINELKRELQLFKDFMRAMRVSNPAMRAIADQMERDEVIRWSSALPRARVTRWGGMISTPDDALQLMIKRALSESGCPPHILDSLMEFCHERRWPRGLSSLETRQNNRRIYDNYICRRIPGKQAVLVLSCDNLHMTEDVMIDPGLVMIFAHGIE